MEMQTIQELGEKIEFRQIRADEADQAVQIEQSCFPPNEACKPDIMRARVKNFPETFLVAVCKESGKLIGMIDGLATNETHLRDEFFTNPELHDPNGDNIMLLGVAVLPEYQKRGIARKMMAHYLQRELERGRSQVVLTCLEEKVGMYQKFGFQDRGESDSAWGGERWHEMVVYRALYGDHGVWVRPASVWNETVERDGKN